MLQVTLHNYNRFEFKDQVMKRNLLIRGSALCINFLSVAPPTICIYNTILLCHKSSHLVTLFIKYSMHYLKVHRTPSGSYRFALYKHTNSACSAPAVNKSKHLQNSKWVPCLQRTDRTLPVLQSKPFVITKANLSTNYH